MGLFGRFRKRKMPSEKEFAKAYESFQKLCDTDIHDIWNIKNTNHFMTAMNSWICKKCGGGSQMQLLSDQERVIYFTFQLEAEVNNGGFYQFFYNAYGDISADLVASFEAIGAEQTAGICKKAVGVFDENLPADRTQRREFLDRTFTDEMSQVLSECDEEFYSQTDDLEKLNYQFIMKNKAGFS